MSETNRQVIPLFSAGTLPPRSIQVGIEDVLIKARETLSQINSVSRDWVAAVEGALATSSTSTKAIAERAWLNAEANTKAAFEAAFSITRAKTPAEAVRLQSSYWQQSSVALCVQAKDMFELSAKLVEQTLESVVAVVTKTTDRAKAS